METIRPFCHPRRVYCAGPLFNEPERREMEQIATVLRRHQFEPFLPHEVVQFAQVHPHLVASGLTEAEAGQTLHEAIFALDVYFVVVGCGALLLNFNGRVPDEGAVAEATMAWMLGKPMVFYKADSRSLIEGRDNPIIAGQTGFRRVEEIEQIGTALARELERVAPDPESVVPCPEHLAETVRKGEQFARQLETLGPDDPAEPTARIVRELFDPSAR